MYNYCPRRKGRPKIHILVCKVCKDEKCPLKKKLPRVRMAKRQKVVRAAKNEYTFMGDLLPQDEDLGLEEEKS